MRTGLRGGFVPGIYMAQQSSYSLGYMAVGNSQSRGWKNSMWSHNDRISCISLIEVADMRHDTSLITGGTAKTAINVANDHSLVVSRFLFYYPSKDFFSFFFKKSQNSNSLLNFSKAGPNFMKGATGRGKAGRNNGPIANELDTSKLNWQRYMEIEEKEEEDN